MSDVASGVDRDPLDDGIVQRMLACACYRLLDYMTAEWADVAPDLLGELYPIVRALPDGRTLSDCYPFPDAGRSDSEPLPENAPHPIPPLLSDIFAVRRDIGASDSFPSMCGSIVSDAGSSFVEARRELQEVYYADQETRDVAEMRFLDAHIYLTSQVLHAEMKLVKRQADWDRLVVLLRGSTFYSTDTFYFDSDTLERPHDVWLRAVTPAMQGVLRGE